MLTIPIFHSISLDTFDTSRKYDEIKNQRERDSIKYFGEKTFSFYFVATPMTCLLIKILTILNKGDIRSDRGRSYFFCSTLENPASSTFSAVGLEV